MKTNLLPALIMLTAGAIDCVLSIAEHLTLFAFTKRLLIVLVVFYVLGCVVKLIVDINFPQMKNAAETEIETETVQEERVTEIEADGQKSEENLENINAVNESE